jgi:hypothetical protein
MPDFLENPDLSRLEAALKGLVPAPAHLDRDRLLFRAGQLTAPRMRWRWPAAAAALAFVAGALGTALTFRPSPTVIVQHVYHERQPAPAPAPVESPEQSPAPDPEPPVPPDPVVARGPQPGGYLQMRNQVLRWGVDALPPPPPAERGPARSRPLPGLRDLSGRSFAFPSLYPGGW